MKLVVLLYGLVTAATLLNTGSAAIAPIDHYMGDNIPIMANSLRSLQALIPYDYYSGPFCAPAVVHTHSPSLGSAILGESIKTSPYSVTMLRNETCKLVATCTPQELSQPRDNIEHLTRLIEDGYRGLLSLDGLPMFNNDVGPVLGGSCVGKIPLAQRFMNMRGYALGVHHNCVGETLVNNHIHFVAEYHAVPSMDGMTTSYRVVGFKGVPYSIDFIKSNIACDGALDVHRKDIIVPLTVDAISQPDHRPMWTYSVSWVERVDVDWSGRWDDYVLSLSSTAHRPRFSIAISILATVVVSSLFWYLYKDARTDIAQYNSCDADTKGQHHEQDILGWVLLHADVFRPPHHANILCIAAGNGVQLLGVVVAVLLLSTIGIFSPGSSGTLLTCMIFVYTLMAGPGGYTCGKLMKMFDEKQSHYVTFMCGAALPGVGLLCFTYLNVQNWHAGASDAKTLLFGLLVTVILPSTFAGSMIAFKQPAIKPVTTIGRIVRDIPSESYSMCTCVTIVSPLFPFVFILCGEVFFVFFAMWVGRLYTSYGYLTFMFILWMYFTIVTTIWVVYIRLSRGNHRWWWSSFLVPGCMGALYFFVFVLCFYFRYLGDVNTTIGTLKYFLVCGFLSVIYGLVSGTIGLLGSLIFTRSIYSRIRVDDAGDVEEGMHCQEDDGDVDTTCINTAGVPTCDH